MEDMYNAQMAKGTALFAVTDHLDVASDTADEMMRSVMASTEEVKRLNDRHGNENILCGIEIAEGFWNMDKYEAAMKMVPYDVVIGSVHKVIYKSLTYPYSLEDFSHYTDKEIVEFLHIYFDDMQKMLSATEFDILAHLTCPLRYIEGKYKIKTDLSLFDGQINSILEEIIKKDIALEVNASSVNVLDDFFPPKNIIKRYYDMGGRRVTLGSDAHKAENASAGLDRAIAALKEIGFDSIYYYRKRKSCRIAL